MTKTAEGERNPGRDCLSEQGRAWPDGRGDRPASGGEHVEHNPNDRASRDAEGEPKAQLETTSRRCPQTYTTLRRLRQALLGRVDSRFFDCGHPEEGGTIQCPRIRRLSHDAGSAESVFPFRLFSTRRARKSVKSPIFCPTLAASRAYM